MMIELKNALTSWDGKSSQDITEIYQQYHSHSSFSEALFSYLSDAKLQMAASWLIKHDLEQGGQVSHQQVSVLFQHIDQNADWQSQLHLLQCFSYLIIPDNLHTQVEFFIRHCLTSDNKFVRAWAYSGFYYLAKQYPFYQPEVREFFELALKDEAASVKARIRQLIKKGF